MAGRLNWTVNYAFRRDEPVHFESLRTWIQRGKYENRRNGKMFINQAIPRDLLDLKAIFELKQP